MHRFDPASDRIGVLLVKAGCTSLELAALIVVLFPFSSVAQILRLQSSQTQGNWTETTRNTKMHALKAAGCRK